MKKRYKKTAVTERVGYAIRSVTNTRKTAEPEEIDFIVCGRTAPGPYAARQSPGSQKTHCSECQAEVWIAASTLAAGIKAPVLCVECAMVKAHEGDEAN